VILLSLLAGQALAHGSEQGLVLLLPTDFYIGSGVLVVVLTLALVLIMPARQSVTLFSSFRLFKSSALYGRAFKTIKVAISLFSLALFIALVLLGFRGTHDPLESHCRLFRA